MTAKWEQDQAADGDAVATTRAAEGAAAERVDAEAAPLPGSEPVSGRRVLCRMCGQPLRDRASRLWGLGPDCRRKLAVRSAPAPARHEVDQDALPGL
ncbi:DUF6011 domain-containing protein [Streptomyces smyrnaeus]|uniref:DUF6011 domain-containing protein n=1 Tax=Streptomyces smyrnaeus TaxID=1387713 RepID=UPI0018476B1C